MFTSTPPICTGRALELSRKDSNIRYLRHLGNSDIAETAKVDFLKGMVEAYGLPDAGKALRCLIDYARANPDKREAIFTEIRCLDC